MVAIRNFRLSFIWVDTVPGLLDGAAPQAPFAWLGRRGDFIYRFDQAQAVHGSQPGVPQPGVPWCEPDSGHTFWQHYFENKSDLRGITGSQAWKRLAPLRRNLPNGVAAGGACSDVRIAGFFFSHGTALAVTLNLRGQAATPIEAAKLAMTLRHDAVLALPDAPKSLLTLDALAAALRKRIHGTDLAGLAVHPGANQPFSIFTVLEADGLTPLSDAKDGDDTHRALEGVTRWNPNFALVDLAQHPLAEALMKPSTHLGLKSDLVYVRRSGAAIWLPRLLHSGQAGRKTLSCYHNNMLHGSIQLRSLVELVNFAKSEAAQGRPPSDAVKERAERAGALLRMMQDGKDSTYRSRLLAAQIDQALAK